VFVCDADDLVSRDLNGIILASTDAHAVMIRHGFEVSVQSHRAFLRHDLHHICGSTFALRTPHAFLNRSAAFEHGLFLRRNHKNLERHLRDQGLSINEPDAPLIAYLRFHGDNESDWMRHETRFSHLRQRLKFGLLARRFDGELAREFGYEG